MCAGSVKIERVRGINEQKAHTKPFSEVVVGDEADRTASDSTIVGSVG